MGDSSGAMTVPKGSEENLVFGFNDLVFSDRILRLEIAPDFDGEIMDEDEESTASGKNLKADKYNDWFSGLQSTKKSEDSDATPKVKILNVCSLLLAGKSQFFYKLFKNGMKESLQKTEFCLKITASEEGTLMDLLRFMYGETALKATSFHDLVDLLIAADKFEVTSCMIHCVEKLFKFPMSLEHALFYLELPPGVLVSEIVKPLIDAAKEYVFSLYKDFTKSEDKAMQLTLSAIEVVLGSTGLEVVSEDTLFDFVLKWARASYPDLEQRREILTKSLAPLICFPNMSVTKLKEVLACDDFDHEPVSKLVHDAVFSKVEHSYAHLINNSLDVSISESGSGVRVYSPHCVVLFDLTRDECKWLSSSNRIDSPVLRLGGKDIYLSVCYAGDSQHFGLSVVKKSAENFNIKFEIAVMKKSSREFESKFKVNNHTVETRLMPNLLGFMKTELMTDDCDYFINDVLCLRVEITLLNS